MEKITRNNKSDWKVKPFSECIKPVRFERSKQIKTNSYLPSGDFPIIDQGQTKIAGWTNDKSAVIKDNIPLIIFGDHTRVFKYINFPFAIGADGTKLIKPRDDKFCSRYFYYYLRSLNLPSKGYSRHFKLLKESEISYPEIPEQKKIAAVLFKIQQAIEVQESIIEAAQELKKSTMQHVFTYGLRGEKTKETEIGRVPESWEIQNISELGEIITGTTPSTKNAVYYQNGEYQFIAPADIGKTTRIYKSEKKISERGLSVSRILPKDTVCIVCIGSTIGKVGITTESKSATNQQINSIIVKDKYEPFFITYLLTYLSEHIASFASSSPVPIISKGKFEKIQVMICKDKYKQQELANILKIIDKKIESSISKKSALQDLFKTMLNKLMTSEIRVKALDIDMADIKH